MAVYTPGEKTLHRKIQKMGRGYGIVIPKQLCDLIGLDSTTIVDMTYTNGKIILKPMGQEG